MAKEPRPVGQETQHKKFNICTVLLNSKAEEETFKKKLNPNDFTFTDFVSDKDDGDDWFDKACSSGVQCDILILSGHFGGRFFGSTGKTLTLDALETHSCRADCKGLLTTPREVFLFGCNTLAGKDGDRRTPEEYLRVLLEDHFSQADAERIVESRYGAYGESNRNRMQWVFSGVPHLYGFDSVGPTAEHVQGMLQRYFDKKGDYAKYLEKDAVTEAIGKVESVNKNKELAGALRATSFTESCGCHVDKGAQFEETKQKTCTFLDPNIPLKTKLQQLEQIVSDGQLLTYMGAARALFRENPPSNMSDEETAILNRIKENADAKNKINGLIEKLKTPITKLELAQIAENIGWITSDQYALIRRDVVLKYLKPPVSIESKDLLCGELAKETAIVGKDLQLKDLSPNSLSDKGTMEALACFAPKVKEVQLAIGDRLTDPNLKFWAINALSAVQPTDPEVQAKLVARFADDDPNTHTFLFNTLLDRLPSVGLSVQIQMADFLDSKYKHSAIFVLSRWNAKSPEIQKKVAPLLAPNNSEKRMALFYFRGVEINNPDIYEKIKALLDDQDEQTQSSAAEVLRNSPLIDKQTAAKIKTIIGKE